MLCDDLGGGRGKWEGGWRGRGYGEKGTLLHHWWKGKLIQPLWRSMWRFLSKLGIKLPFDLPISLPAIYPEKTVIEKEL